MNLTYQKYLKNSFGIDETIIKLVQSAENEISDVFQRKLQENILLSILHLK